MASILIALSALGLTVYQSRVTIEHNRRSVEPALDVEGYLGSGNRAPGLYLRSVGLGPAIAYPPVVFDNTTGDYVTTLATQDSGAEVQDHFGLYNFQGLTITSLIGPTFLAADSSLELVVYSPPSGFPAVLPDAFAMGVARMFMAVCYCSVYDECWIGGTPDRARIETSCESLEISDYARLLPG